MQLQASLQVLRQRWLGLALVLCRLRKGFRVWAQALQQQGRARRSRTGYFREEGVQARLLLLLLSLLLLVLRL